jgi:peptide/nickel transport system substrate-binding protein
MGEKSLEVLERTVPEEKIAPPHEAKRARWRIWAVLAVVAILVIAAIGAYLILGVEKKNSLPCVVAFVSSTTAQPGIQLEFNGTSSWDIDGKIVSYAWDFGDGSKAEGAIVSHSYSTHGSYVVTLMVEDDEGGTANNDVSLVHIQVFPLNPPEASTSPPVAVVLTDGNSQAPGSTVAFDGTSSWQWTELDGTWVGLNVPGLAYEWDFNGDGVADSTSAKVTQVFSEPGNFPVRLKVTNSTTGSSNTTINTIRILEPEPAYEGDIPNPNVYIHMLPAELSFIDPAHDYTWPGFDNFFANIYEPLVTYDRDDVNTLVPLIAEQIPTIANGGISPDGLNYTFKIREGITFHSGEALTAYDVEYSFDRMMVMNLPDGPAWELLEALNTSGTQVINEYTIQCNLSRPYSPFLKLLTFGNFGILSKNFVIANGGWDPSVPGSNLPYDGGKNASGWGGRNDAFMESHMCGSGAYRLSEWKRGLSIELERFDQYWRGPAAIKTIIIQLASEFTPRLLALQGKQADAIYVQSDLQQVAAVRALRANDFRIVSGSPTFSETAKIHLNQKIALDLLPPTDNVPADFFQDIHVRKAFNYAVDRHAIIESARAGQAIVSTGLLPPSAFGYNPDVPTYDFNPAKVEQELRLAKASDGQSWWDKGFRLTGIVMSGAPAYTAILLNLKDNLESINPRITIDVQELDLPAFFTKWVTWGYAIMATTMYAEYGDPQTWLGQEATSYGFIAKFAGAPTTLDALVADQLNATDPAVRAALIREIQQQQYEEAWWVWIDYTLALDASGPWVKGYYFNPLRSHPLYYDISKG